MVAQQSVGKRVGDGLDVFDVQAEKVGIVALFDKDVFAIVAAIVDVIVFAVFKWSRLRHGVFVRRPDRSLETPVRSILKLTYLPVGNVAFAPLNGVLIE